MRRSRVGMVGTLAGALFALLYACVGSDPDPLSPTPDASTSATSSSTSSSGGTGTSSSSSSSSGSGGVDAGPPKCKGSEDRCNGDCVDTATYATSKDNCGACGHSCGGGECKKAACGPTVVVENIQEEDGFDVMDGYVYFVTNDGEHTKADVRRCKVTGCAPEEVVFSTTAMGAQAQTVFASGGVFAVNFNPNSNNSSLKFCPAKGCLSSNAEGNTDRIVYGTAGPRFFFAGGIGPSSLWMRECHPTDSDAGCTETKLLQNAVTSVGIGMKGATDGTSLTYQRPHDGGGDELALCSDVTVGCDGGTTVAETMPEHNVITAKKLFMMRKGSPPASQPNGHIEVCDLPCTSVPTDFVKATPNLTDLAADAQDIFWMSPAPGYDAILTCPVTGCANGKQIVTGLGANPRELRVDNGFVYWTSDTSADAAVDRRDIHRVAKPLK